MAEAKSVISLDGNAATVHTAHALNEVMTIYPITPSSGMGELADEYSVHGRRNIFGNVPRVYEMQSEAGAAAAVHGALSGGSLCTTFTASQGLLLMIPNMYKISGELLPTVFHVSARSISTHALSIFGDHSDVMTVRECGWALVAQSNQQEIMDFGCISQGTTLKSRIPFLNFFDGFRTSHEIRKAELVPMDVMKKMVDPEDVERFRSLAMNPDRPFYKGTAMNPDIFFQAREACNPFYMKVPDIFELFCRRFEDLTGRSYHAFDYYGAPDAETVMVIMGSAADVVEECVDYLTARGEKVGEIKVRLYRPFDTKRFVEALPETCRNLVIMDRTKEPGAPGEPLYLDVVAAFDKHIALGDVPGDRRPRIVGGRYGLSSKNFTTGMAKAAFDYGKKPLERDRFLMGFTVGIDDDVTRLSLEVPEDIDTAHPTLRRLKFYGMGGDGTVSANKNSIKIIGDQSGKAVQGYFQYDAKKAGGLTLSHLRFSDEADIRSSFFIEKPDFVAIHNKEYIGIYNMLSGIQEGGTVLLNTDLPAEKVFASFPEEDQKVLIEKKCKLYTIDAHKIVDGIGLPGRINTTMQAAFFKISQVLSDEVYIPAVEEAIAKTLGKKGEKVVSINKKAFHLGLEEIAEIPIPDAPVKSTCYCPTLRVKPEDQEFEDVLKNVIEPVMHFDGDSVKVSQVSPDGVFPTGTTRYEKRNLATHLPKWTPSNCIQCGFCAFSCPAASIRVRVNKRSDIPLSDEDYPTIARKAKGATEEDRFRVQLAPDDCTGCGVCVDICSGNKKRETLTMVPKTEILDSARKTFEAYLTLPETDPVWIGAKTAKTAMLREPLMEFSGACAGCGETPYIKLITQLVGDRMVQANATGCSSIYGGTAPTTPYCKNKRGEGPTWASSLFEDAAEFALGMRLGIDNLASDAFALRETLLASGDTPADVKTALEKIPPLSEQIKQEAFEKARDAVDAIRALTEGADPGSHLGRLHQAADYLKYKAVFGVGGDGWAYDIGYGGLDHVVASGMDINLIVLDTEVYSNTGGQRSKATPLGGVAKFAAAGKEVPKKDMGLMCMAYGNVYIGSCNFGANPAQTLRAVREALDPRSCSCIRTASSTGLTWVRARRRPNSPSIPDTGSSTGTIRACSRRERIPSRSTAGNRRRT
ncbi:MAG: pyruvate:ferredoxin (flavodoxin) oxidoreductase [Planctomycetota bacterium]|jgi:pyruvate-ferredoxin/flavodoxin oxidoreductase